MLPLLVVSLTGALLVYKKPLIRVIVTQSAQLPKSYTQQSIARQIDAIELLFNQADCVRIKAPNEQEPYWTLTNAEEKHTLYSVESLTKFESNLWLLKAFTFIHHLHTSLLSNDVGQIVLLISAMVALIMLVSGIYLWWPGRKGFRWRFIKPFPFKLRMSLQLHRHTGIVAAPILLIIMLTGGIILWQKLVGPIFAPIAMREDIQKHSYSSAQFVASTALSVAKEKLPDGRLTYIRPPNGEHNYYRFRFRLPREWHPNGRTSINVHTDSPVIKLTPRSDKLPWPNQLVNQIYPFHSGYGINGPYQSLVLFGGWVLFWLSITGLLSYIRQTVLKIK